MREEEYNRLPAICVRYVSCVALLNGRFYRLTFSICACRSVLQISVVGRIQQQRVGILGSIMHYVDNVQNAFAFLCSLSLVGIWLYSSHVWNCCLMIFTFKMCSIQQKFSSIQHMAPLEFPNRNIQFLSLCQRHRNRILIGKTQSHFSFRDKRQTEDDVSATINFRDIKKQYYCVKRQMKYQVIIIN